MQEVRDDLTSFREEPALETVKDSSSFDRMAYLSTILTTLPEAVAVFDREFRLVELNPAGLALASDQGEGSL